jgi:PAS domain S-box-containing protein
VSLDSNQRTTEAALRLVLSTVLDAVVVIDGDGLVTGWNEAAERTFGWSADEALGRSLSDLIIPHQHREGHAAGMRRYQESGDARVVNRRIEITALHRSGREFPVELSITPAPAGTQAAFIGFMRDISGPREAADALDAARRHAEEVAREREAILSQLSEAVILADAEGRLTFVNDAAVRLHGHRILGVGPEEYSETYHLLTTDGEPHPPEDLPLYRAVKGETVREARWQIRRPDGSVVLAVGSAQPLFSPDGAQIGAVLTARDETERYRAEQQIRDNEARLRTLTDNLPGGAVYQIWASPDGSQRRFTFLSHSYERLAGIPAEAVMADPSLAYNAIDPEDLPLFAEAEAAAIRDKTPFDVQARFRRADGVMRWCRFISAPREQEDGSTIWDGLQIDVTMRIEALNALRELNETLEARVETALAEREAAHEQLRQSQKMEAMGQLTGGVAHDFNNLLTPIVGSLDMLQRRGLGSEREQRLIAGAMQSAERAKTLVQRLLAFARRQPLQPAPVNVASLVAGIADLIASTTGPQIKVVLHVPEDLATALADQNQLEMALLNLAVNARDAMPGGGTLRISVSEERIDACASPKLPAGRYVRLSVADTGLGMSEETLARAVEPFFSTKGVGKGTGLGLSMVHGLAAQLGGALTIQSQLGLGTNVELWLPVSGRQAEAPAQAGGGELAHRSGTALLVDDEDLVRASTAEMLSDLGYEVVEASSAEEALAAIGRGVTPGLLVTDHLMPGMTGTELIRRVRQQHPALPALLVSGYAEVEDIAPDLPRLTKPFRQADLAASIANLVDKRVQAAGEPGPS